MSTTNIFRGTPTQANEAYLRLVSHFPLRPIRDENEYDQRSWLLDQILDLGDADEQTEWFVEVLTLLIEHYDREHYPDPPVAPHAMLAHLLQQFGMNQAELARRLGVSPSLVCDLVNGRANFTMKRIHELAEVFAVDPSVFV